MASVSRPADAPLGFEGAEGRAHELRIGDAFEGQADDGRQCCIGWIESGRDLVEEPVGKVARPHIPLFRSMGHRDPRPVADQFSGSRQVRERRRQQGLGHGEVAGDGLGRQRHPGCVPADGDVLGDLLADHGHGHFSVRHEGVGVRRT